MPYKDKEWHKHKRRCWRRDQRHPGWRQTYVDCDGECQWKVEGYLCRDRDLLEFHHYYMKKKRNGDEYKEMRTLYCLRHHQETHIDDTGIVCNERHYPSMLQEDICVEIEEAGSYDKWIEKHGLVKPQKAEMTGEPNA